MSYKFEEGKDAIIQSVAQRIEQKLKGEQTALCNQFAKKFLATVALDDLSEWKIDDLYAAMLNYWTLIYQRAPGEQKIRIYNPEYERHGWQTTHTVIEIIHDDMPFLVDSIQMEINRMGLTSHLLIHMGGFKVIRDEKHCISKICNDEDKSNGKFISSEAPVFIEIDRQTNPDVLNELHTNLERVLEDNRAVVNDWQDIRGKVLEAINDIDKCGKFIDKAELTESKDFLAWLEDHHFTFLGVRDYELNHEDGEVILRPIPKTGLGVLRRSTGSSSCRSVSAMTPEARALTLSPQMLVISKTNTRSTVHRPIYTDYIGIKRFNNKGEVIGERRIIGLYTSAAYHTNPKHIPFLRRKVAQVMEMSRLGFKSHAGKVLQNILDTLPRDDLFQASPEDLLRVCMGIFHMQERRKIRMFSIKDVYGRFISCLVYVPRELFNTELRRAMQEILCDSFSAIECSFSTRFSDSVLARIHFLVKVNPHKAVDVDYKELEKKLIEVGRTWSDELKDSLLDAFGEEECNRLYDIYGDAFSVGYKESFSSRTGLYDIKHIEQLSDSEPMGMNFYRPVGEISGSLRLKVYQFDETVPLSDVLPILENLGLRVISERPYVLRLKTGRKVWVNDFGMLYCLNEQLDVDFIKDRFQEAFLRIWLKQAENDGFNQLVLGAGIDWREVSMLRGYAKFFKQIRYTFSQEYIISALNKNTEITKKLVSLFTTRMTIKKLKDREKEAQQIAESIIEDLESVPNLDEDKIIRHYIDVIYATLRTNYYQITDKGEPKSYISFKLDPSKIPNVPLPHPMYEIFVYSPRFEGVHLRCGKVARGGLRWSDRREDFRTEVLGLMKAQQVKNAVIVPSGAKGGFVPKNLPVDGSREDIMAEGIACYKRFISGLLDITDNYKGTDIVKPERVYCYDDDDPYLVVAADKGTATFSDIANEISEEYGFWLGDAFASGGSTGYDHKKMGITAKGAWESVKRLFREQGTNIQTTDFTCVGIGDMAGDVFGNGMLLSEHICLVAAFNHMHIFIDPNPNSKESFKERQRLFNLPRSSWRDYDEKLISKGGGIFDRNAKSIQLTPEIKKRFNLKQNKIEPNDLIKELLSSEVDLLWSGGIGTFVRSSQETDIEVGDRTNDFIRVEATKLKAKVVGEGGNLGFTQLARIEYAMNGGMIYTDFIDNSAGVDCSDNEVNIKILLNTACANGDLTEKQRNQLLSDMTDEVAELVLSDNYQQTQAISLAARQALRNVELHGRYIDYLETSGNLDRELEFIPDEKALLERKLSGKGLLRPGIAVLLCYSKILINEQIIESDVPEDEYLSKILTEAFPKPLQKKFADLMESHKLRREIIATKLSNIIVNEMGFTFIYRLQDETGAPTSAIVRAYLIAREVFSLPRLWREIQKLDNKISSEVQTDMMMQFIRLLRRTTRWFLRSKRKRLNITESVKQYGPGVKKLAATLPKVLYGTELEKYERGIKNLTDVGVPTALAKDMALSRSFFSALDIIDAGTELKQPIDKVAELYFGVGEFLDLNWIRSQIIMHPTDNHWEALSREALRDDLDWQQRHLATGILRRYGELKSLKDHLNDWASRYPELIERWQYTQADLKASKVLNYTMYFVAIRELLDLTQTTVQTASAEAG